VSDSLVKLGAPARAGDIVRPRVAERLSRAMRRAVTLVVAPAGYGKSAAVASIGAARTCRLRGVETSLADVALAVASVLAPSRAGLAAAIVASAGRDDAPAALAAWMAEVAPHDATVVIDDLDDALALPGVAAFVDALVTGTATTVRWVLTARSLDPFPVARWMAAGLAGVPVDDAVLGLRPDELRRILAGAGIDRSALPGVELRLATVRLACDLLAAGAPARAVAGAARSLQRLTDLAFTDAAEDEREALVSAAHAVALTEPVLASLPRSTAKSLARLRARLPSAFEASGAATWFRAAIRERAGGGRRYAGAAARGDAARAASGSTSVGAAPSAEAWAAEIARAEDALRRGDVEAAGAAAWRAAALAEEADAFALAARAHAVLHELAVDAGEPAAALATAEDVAHLAALAGEHDLRASALAAAHRLHAARGDEDGMRRAEGALAFVAPAAAGRAALAMLGGRALARAWNGDAAGAHAILAGADLAEAHAAGRAARWAEIACFAAAAGRRAEARTAAAAADSELYQVTESAARDRAHALLAVAATLAGDDEGARRRLPRPAAGAVSRRTAVLLDAAGAFRRARCGEADAAEVAAALERARAEGAGGFARLIEALLAAPTHRDATGETAGSDVADEAVARLLSELEEHDEGTAAHTRAVGAWCARIAARLGLDAAGVRHAERSGLLHDIGKARVPAALLVAPRGLDDDERAVVQAHAAYGAETLLAHPALVPFAAAVRAHHERYDGRGYPDRLAGERIPLAARIIAVADAFDAMIAPRPYRAPRTPSAALLELHRERGRQFDPDAVDAMIAVVEADG
jgi:HD-GYP domain-containing protein (c-di-GMP phosphodiesterase class II)